jgi:preprotein translocase subunit SecD
MNFRLTVLILFSFTLHFITSYETSSSTTDLNVKQPFSNTIQKAVADTNDREIRDGLPVIPIPGAQIDEDKVDAMLEEGNTSFSVINKARATEEDLKNNVEKLNQLLQKERVRDDKELQFTFHTMLGLTNRRLYKKTEQKDYLNKATEHADSAISIFENQPEYKADLADAYMLRNSIHLEKNEYGNAISLMKYLIEEFQEIGYGPYKNWFASKQVEKLSNLSRMNSLKPGKTQEIVDYLSKIAERYNNEVGVTAQIILAKHNVRKNEQEDLGTISELIKNRLASLNNAAFEEEKLGQFKDYLAQIEYRKKKTKGLTGRDTLFYEIQSQMIDQTRIKKSQISDEYRTHFRLKEKYHSEFRQLTRENIGNFLAVVYEGEILSSGLPTIQASISNGRFSMVFKEEEQAKKILHQIGEKMK